MATKKAKGLSALDAAEKVLGEAKGPMTTKEIVAKIKQRKLAPALRGKTPEATVGALIAVSIKKKQGRFKRTSPGRFTVAKRSR
jgi:hypothetical protein